MQLILSSPTPIHYAAIPTVHISYCIVAYYCIYSTVDRTTVGLCSRAYNLSLLLASLGVID